jgi:hypothetical protein
LPNGSFEDKLAGWHTGQAGSESFQPATSPTADGDWACAAPNRQAGGLSSDPLLVEPGMLLHASMKVYNLTLTYHRTSPRVTLEFENTDHKTVSSGPITAYSLPYVADGAAGWQQVAVQAVVPRNARYVRFSIVTEATGLNQGRPFYVDDAHLTAIRWEPAP